MRTDRPITRVTWHAKQRYCERRAIKSIESIDAVRMKRGTKKDFLALEEIERTILKIVNNEAEVIKGLTKNNRDNALLLHNGLCYAVRYEKGKGVVITVMLDHP